MRALLDQCVERGSAFVPGELDVGYTMMLFYGLTVTKIIDVAEGIAILPYEDVRPFVDESLVEELSPDSAGFHHWAICWSCGQTFPMEAALNRSGYEREPVLERPKSLFLDARSILDLLAVAHEAAVVPLAELPHCINRSAARLLGWDGHGPNASWRNPAKNSDGFEKCPELAPTAFTEAKEAFDNRTSHQYAKMAPIVSRLAETLDPKGRFAAETRVGEIGAALERMYDVGKRENLAQIAEQRISGFLGTDDESRESIKTTVKEFYDARSEIVHGRTDKISLSEPERPTSKDSKSLGGRCSSSCARDHPTTGTRTRSRGAKTQVEAVCAIVNQRIRWDANLETPLIQAEFDLPKTLSVWCLFGYSGLKPVHDKEQHG